MLLIAGCPSDTAAADDPDVTVPFA